MDVVAAGPTLLVEAERGSRRPPRDAAVADQGLRVVLEASLQHEPRQVRLPDLARREGEHPLAVGLLVGGFVLVGDVIVALYGCRSVLPPSAEGERQLVRSHTKISRLKHNPSTTQHIPHPV